MTSKSTAAPELSGRELEEQSVRRLTSGMIAANVVGAVIVFTFLQWVVPTPAVRNPATLTRLNLILFIVALPVMVGVGRVVSLRHSAPVRAWQIAERAPDDRERALTLALPLRLTLVAAALWSLAALCFGTVNVTRSAALGVEVSGTILLGGLATCALVYLLAERFMRPVTGRALAARAPAGALRPGVATRMLLAWIFGTGICVVGIVLVAGGFLADAAISPRRLSATVLFLSAVALVAGLATALIAARSVADPIDSVRRALAEVEQGNVDVEVPVYDASEIGLLQAGFNRMVSELRERDRLRDLFGRHVGEDVAREALERGIRLGGEARDVAVLFVDVIGSTALASSREPEEVVAALNRFFAIVLDVVTAHGGWINKFEGDAALCVFGAPTPHPSAPTGALAAARKLAERLARELPEVEAAVGVSAGRVVAGNVGASKRFEYTVIGDAVNEAARLTDLAKTRQQPVLASQTIVAAAEPAEEKRWELGDALTLRGRAEPTTTATPCTSPTGRGTRSPSSAPPRS
ncbi:MAG: adenylate cyclase [Solirubrobacteraceae bacterium]|nr:adenylate cyclase [Solirubrobacteraceae bacterium]